MNIKEIIKNFDLAMSEVDESEGVAYIYSLINSDGECIYVGRTTNLSKRIIQHKLDGKDFVDVDYILVDRGDSYNAESLMILFKNPPLNKTAGKNDYFIRNSDLSARVESIISELDFIEMKENRKPIRYIEKTKADLIIYMLSNAVNEAMEMREFDFESIISGMKI